MDIATAVASGTTQGVEGGSDADDFVSLPYILIPNRA